MASILVIDDEPVIRTLLRTVLDKYGRTLATVMLPDGRNLNHELVREGWCWWYRKYGPGDTVREG
jgi:micrococcal nuclease